MTDPKTPIPSPLSIPRPSGERPAVLQDAIEKTTATGDKLDALNERLDAAKTQVATRTTPGEKTSSVGLWVLVVQGYGPRRNDGTPDADAMAIGFVHVLRSAGHTIDTASFSADGAAVSLTDERKEEP